MISYNTLREKNKCAWPLPIKVIAEAALAILATSNATDTTQLPFGTKPAVMMRDIDLNLERRCR